MFGFLFSLVEVVFVRSPESSFTQLPNGRLGRAGLRSSLIRHGWFFCFVFLPILGKASEVTTNEVYAFAGFKVADGDR